MGSLFVFVIDVFTTIVCNFVGEFACIPLPMALSTCTNLTMNESETIAKKKKNQGHIKYD